MPPRKIDLENAPEPTRIALQITEMIFAIDRVLNEGLNDAKSDILKQSIRQSTQLFLKTKEILARIIKNESRKFNPVNHEQFLELVQLQNRLVRKCHLATMAVIYFSSGKLKFLAPMAEPESIQPRIKKPSRTKNNAC